MLTVAVFAVSANGSQENDSGKSDEPKIALIVNQRSGDLGPIDNMFEGADRFEQDFNVDVKKLESESVSDYEEDIRAMAKAGYDLILTTFPPMTEATKTVAKEYPDVKFAAIFQWINVDGQKVPNIWDTEYRGEQVYYILGAMAALLTESNQIGFVGGDESAGVYNTANGFMHGVKDFNPNANVEIMIVGSYEDPAKTKEMVKAMISKGVDVVQTDCGKSQLGAIEAAKEANIFVSGDVSDNFEMYPNGFYSYNGINFGENVYIACKTFMDDTFPAGEHGFMNIDSGTYYIPFDVLEKLAASNPDKEDKIKEVKKAAIDISEKIKNKDIIVEYDITAPNWTRIKEE
jgi:basic membrane protein A